MISLRHLFVGIALATTTAARAELKLPTFFGDNMVLQQQMAVPVWGWAAPGAEVTVSFAGQTKTTQADADGKWLVKLGKLKASAEPRSLVVQSGETKTFTNILVGEVWLASGQSNMEKPIGNQPGQKPVYNAEEELASGSNFPQIRVFKVFKRLAATPQVDVPEHQGWAQCSSNVLEKFSFSAAA